MRTKERIKRLGQTQAAEILETIARYRLASGPPLELTPQLRAQLASTFGLLGASLPTVSEGELAQQALMVLSEDPATAVAISTMVDQPIRVAQKLDLGATIALTTAVLVVLQTHYKFERHTNGTWTLKLEKKPTSELLLKTLVQKLLGYSK
ncbi:hypothetical protein [Acidisarcina polymorpha]|uniref:hypothetical protein n=1 Tax=Acidisarcina polymorpha TaxID=2211140 RepID=UPI000DEF589B|nr:hypothetical protein [Acidisarcina polymorpha]